MKFFSYFLFLTGLMISPPPAFSSDCSENFTQDQVTHLETLLKNKNTPEGQSQLGEFYGNQKDFKKAIRWFKKAALEEYPKAAEQVATLYKEEIPGTDPMKNASKAYAWALISKNKELIDKFKEGLTNIQISMADEEARQIRQEIKDIQEN